MPPFEGLFDAITAYHYRAEWITTVDAFLADPEASADLTGAERDLLVAQSQAWLSYWLIEATAPDGTLAARDLLTGELRTLTAPRRPASWRPGRVLLARVVDHDALSFIAGAASLTLTPDEATRAQGPAYDLLEPEVRRFSVARLRRSDASMVLADCWFSALEELRCDAEDPALLTHDDRGHRVIHVEDRLLVAPERRDEVTRLLDTRVGGPAPLGPDWEAVARTPDPDDPRGQRELGRLTLCGDRLTLEAYSVEDADQLLALVVHRCPGLLRFEVRIATDVGVRYAQLCAAERAQAQAVPALFPSMPDEVTHWATARAYELWPDQPCEALHGLTPREVSVKRGPRTELRQLLDDFERAEAEKPPDYRNDLRPLRRALRLGK